MRTPRARTLVAIVIAAAVVLLGSAAPGAAQTPTSVSVGISPASPVAELTPVTFHVAVSPAEATGVVALMANGAQVASGLVSSGAVDLVVGSLPTGSVNVVANFLPADALAFSSAASTPQVIQVIPLGSIAMTIASGAPVAAGGPVPVGADVDVQVWNFPAGSVATASLTSTGLTAQFTTDDAGSGHVRIHLPGSLASRVYRLTATSGRVSATFVFYVYNPHAQPAATPSPLPTERATASAPIVAPVTTSEALPVTGQPSSLSETGAGLVRLSPLALLVIGIGVVLLLTSRERRRDHGRHQAQSRAPRHARR